MGLLDSAKSKFSEAFGEETVKIGFFGDEEKEEKNKKVKEVKQKEEKIPVQKPIKPEKPARVEKREKKVKVPRQKTPRDNEYNLVDTDVSNEILDNGTTIEKPQRKNNEESNSKNKSGSTAFEVDDVETEFLELQKKTYEKEMEKYHDIPMLEARGNRVQDVLEVLKIPETFFIESNIFLPEDLEVIKFDLQTPYGYEQGQVEAFMEQTRNSVKRYRDLLKERNEHVAKLATVIDRLQVDMNNMRYENEMASGINIMASSSDDDLENSLLEAKLKIKRLEQEIKELTDSTVIDEKRNINAKLIDDIQDQNAILSRENEQLLEENNDLKNQLALLIDETDYDERDRSNRTESIYHDNTAMSLPDISITDSNEKKDLELPAIEIMGDSKNYRTIEENMVPEDAIEDNVDKFMKEWDTNK